jgi:DNA gyrase subunit A
MKRSLKDFSEEDLIPDEPMVVMLTQSNYIKRLPPSTYKSQHRGGKGVSGITTKEEDSVEHILTTTTHTELFFFTSTGRVFRLKTWEIPQASRTAKGQAIVNLLQLKPEERITAMFPVEKNNEATKYYFMATTGGTVKKTPIEDFANVRASGLIAIKLKENEQLAWVEPTTGKDHLMLVTAQGQSVMFAESDVRPMGRASQGVRGIKLKGDDRVVQLLKIPEAEGSIFVLAKNGYGKMSKKKEFAAQKRGGSGVRIAKVTQKTGKLVGARFMYIPEDSGADIMVTSTQGQIIRLPVKSIPTIGRSTQGVIMMRLDKEDYVVSFALYKEDTVGTEAISVEEKATLAL